MPALSSLLIGSKFILVRALIYGAGNKGEKKMNLHEIEKDYENYILRPSFSQHHIGMFMQHTINIFKDQSDMIADLRKELAQKENIIDVNDIKEMRNLNG